jgi:hypothetical protein
VLPQYPFLHCAIPVFVIRDLAPSNAFVKLNGSLVLRMYRQVHPVASQLLCPPLGFRHETLPHAVALAVRENSDGQYSEGGLSGIILHRGSLLLPLESAQGSCA